MGSHFNDFIFLDMTQLVGSELRGGEASTTWFHHTQKAQPGCLHHWPMSCLAKSCAEFGLIPLEDTLW